MPDDAGRPVAAAVVTAQNVAISYAGRAALRDFSLSIGAGEIVGLIGEAACGKTTAALAMLGLVRPPGRVEAGSVAMDGHDLLRMKPAALRALRGRDIGLIVQSPRSALNPLLPIGRQIATVYRAHNKVSRAAARAHAVAMLRRVGINDPERRTHAFPHEISGGMAQRVLIAIALSLAAAPAGRRRADQRTRRHHPGGFSGPPLAHHPRGGARPCCSSHRISASSRTTATASW